MKLCLPAVFGSPSALSVWWVHASMQESVPMQGPMPAHLVARAEYRCLPLPLLTLLP